MYGTLPSWHYQNRNRWTGARADVCLRAWALHQQGWKQTQIADALSVTQGAVSQWVQRGKAGGSAALRRRPAPGSVSRLTVAHRAQLVNALAQGATTFGFIGEVWTTKRIAAIINSSCYLDVGVHEAVLASW